MESKNDSKGDDVGSIRWAIGSEPSTSTPSKQSRIIIHREVHSDVQSISPVNYGNTNRGSFSMDVNAFEKSLQEKRDRQFRDSPRIEIRLRETSTSSPRDFASPSSSSKIDIQHVERESGGAHGTSVDEVDYSSPAPRKIKRIITYEKVSKTKSIREITLPGNVQSPVVQRTVDCLVDKSSSTEQITPTEDSAYHSHRIRLTSSGTPTTISISSSSDSIQHVFTSDENVYAPRTPSRSERIFLEHAGSEPLPPHSIGIESSKNRSSVDSTIKQQRQVVSPVTDGNEHVHHRHLESYRTSSESEGISSDWYNEYQTQTVQVDHRRPNKMDFKRSNSQYDNHIRQIRGIYESLYTMTHHIC